MTASINVITWMHSHSQGDKTLYPNGGDPTDPNTQDIYWRCAVTLLHSAWAVNPNCPLRLHLFFNQSPPCEIEHVDLGDCFRAIGAELHYLDEHTIIPSDYFDSVTSQFLLIDLLEQLVGMVDRGEFTDRDLFLVLDSDMIFQRSIGQEFIDALEQDGCVNFATKFANDVEWTEDTLYGYTMPELLTLCREFQSEPLPEYYSANGEFFAFTAKELRKIAAEARRIFTICLERHAKGMAKLNTEEMLFGYVFSKLGYPRNVGGNKKFVDRVWTYPHCYQYDATIHNDYMLLHLPAEKTQILANYFRDLRSTFPATTRRLAVPL